MINPTSFYRKMDALLSRIGSATTHDDFLSTTIQALEDVFGAELYMQDGRLFQEENRVYMQVTPPSEMELLDDASDPLYQDQESFDAASEEASHEPTVLHPEGVRLVLYHGSYIFDAAPETLLDGANAGAKTDGTVPAAFAISQGTTGRWIVVYDLLPGWRREEVQLCLNAVRSALNNRLFAVNINNDMEQAAQIQRSLLPEQAPALPGFDIAGRSYAAETVGGDLYDYYLLGDEVFGVSIGDASGHGLPAALLVRDVVTGLRMGLEANFKISYTVRKLNEVINRSAYTSRFISLFYGEIERNGNLLYINAGHPPPLLVHASGQTTLGATGTVIGPLTEYTIYRDYVAFQPGSVLVLYTDGIIERSDAEGDLYDMERLQALVQANRHASAPDLLDLIFDTVCAFGDDTPWTDDATVVVIKRL